MRCGVSDDVDVVDDTLMGAYDVGGWCCCDTNTCCLHQWCVSRWYVAKNMNWCAGEIRSEDGQAEDRYAYTHTYTHRDTHTHTHSLIHSLIHSFNILAQGICHTHTHTHTHTHIHTYTHTHTYIHAQGTDT